jgi:hypothetical protein
MIIGGPAKTEFGHLANMAQVLPHDPTSSVEMLFKIFLQQYQHDGHENHMKER